MAAWSEQQARDQLMTTFVAQDPIPIDLQRPTFSLTAAGGRIQSALAAVGAQDFYFVPFKRRLTVEYTFNPQSFGEDKVEYIHYILIYPFGTDIEVDDFFTVTGSDRLENGLYTVVFISPRQWDRGQAGVIYRG